MREPTETSPPASIDSPKRRPEDSVLIRRLLYVVFFLEVGLLLIVLPWSTFWEENYFGYVWPALAPFLRNDFIRGAVSGVGLVNLFAGFADLIPVIIVRNRPEANS